MRRPLAALVASTAVSSVGAAMTLVAVPWFVLHTTGSGAQTGMVAAAEALGLLLSVALAGPLVDRYGARRMSVLADLFAAVSVAAIPLVHGTLGLSLPVLMVLSLAIGAGRAPARTAKQVLLPATGAPIARGASAQEAVQRLGDLLGAPAGGVLIALLSPPPVLLLDAATLVAAAALVGFFVPKGQSDSRRVKSGYLRELRESAVALRRDRLLLALCLLCAGTNALGIGLFTVLLPAYGTMVWHDSTIVGLVIAASGAGGLLGSLVFGWLGPRWRRRPTFTICFLLCGPPAFALVAADLPPALLVAAIGVTALANGPLNPLIAAVKFDRVAPGLRGRVFGAISSVALAAMPLGNLVAGVLLDAAGLRTALLALGGAYLLLTLCPLLFRVWRELDAPPLVTLGPGPAG
ncbi:MFS transporter [Amycolatopsis sp. YIM 10]|uniref:MFS transporter n=1 Tax=Amycolatopsis sp. YIM 10 TaxID=2653857 RepID=UPI00128FE031|nr:MFS transporter [Amycolatopsis sp. YIM 10]QFU90610.1 putative multidrug-efflux transporter [Amycolatopsis sp. YIM 10]